MKRKWKIVLIVSLLGNIAIFYVGNKALEYRSHINLYLDKYTNIVDEFSGRSFYYKDNIYLKNQPNNGNRVVLFGTQTIERWQINDTGGQYEIINRGLSHQRIAGFLLRFKPDVIDLEPDYVLIEVSSYNFRPYSQISEIKDYVSSMAELARYHKIKPILTTTVPLLKGADTLDGYSMVDSLEVYNDWIKEFCFTNKLILFDFNDLLSDEEPFLRQNLSSGPIDLNDEGYKVLTEGLLELLNNYK